MPTNILSKGASKKALKRRRKSIHVNGRAKKIKLYQSKKKTRKGKALQDYIVKHADKPGNKSKNGKIADKKDGNKKVRFWDELSEEWGRNKNFFRAPQVIVDEAVNEDHYEDEQQDDGNNENEDDSDYDFGDMEPLDDAVVVEANVVPEYKESDGGSEEEFESEFYEEEDDEETYEGYAEQESDVEEKDQQMLEEDSIETESEPDEYDPNSAELEPGDGEDGQESVIEEDLIKQESENENEGLESDGDVIDGEEDNENDEELQEDTRPKVVGDKSPEINETHEVFVLNPAAPFYAQSTTEPTRRGPLRELSIFENSLKTNKVLALVKEGMECYGTVIVTLLAGRISINGYEARQLEPLTVYSPKGLNWVVISPLTTKKRPKIGFELVASVLEESFSRAQLDKISKNYDRKRDAIVLLQRNSAAQTMINTFAKQMSENVFPVVNATNRPHYSSEYLLNCLLQNADPDPVPDQQRVLSVPRVWTKLALHQDSRFMITGGRGVGKSTLLRYLLNRHLPQFKSVLVVDLDIGQPELFVPQTVSCSVVDAPLLGPGFFFNRQPDMAFVVGHVNIVMCAEQYAHAVKRLLAYCGSQERYKEMPWLINTMGYNKGFGVELMALLVDAVKPTALVQISSPKQINNFDVTLDSATLSQVVPSIYVDDPFKLSLPLPKYAMHKLQSAVPVPVQGQQKSWRMSAKDMRYSNLLARLSTALRGNVKYLSECQPLKMPLDNLNFLHLTSEEYSRDELIAGTEVNMVYLCKQILKSNQPIECLGIGVVRAIDYGKNNLYLVPAMPVERCAAINCLVIGGDTFLPQGFIKDQGATVTDHVPFVFVIDDSKSSKSVQQIYHRAPGFLGNPANKTQ